MAEALAIVGALAACLQLAKGFSELGKSIVAASQGIRYVPEYISELKDSAELFTISLRKLVRAAKKAYSDNKESTEARETAKAMDIIRSQGRKLKPKIYDLVRQVEGRLFSSTFSQLFSKLRVLFKQTGVQSLQNSLHRLMHTTHLLGSGIILDTLLARIKKLEDEDIPVSEDLRDEVSLLRQEIQTHRSIAKDLEKRLKVQIEGSSTGDSLSRDMAKMLDASQKLDHYVERTVSRVAPELVATRRRKRKVRSSRPPRSLRESYLSSYHASPLHSTPPTSPSSARHWQQERSRGIRELPRTRSTTPPSQMGPPLFNVPERREKRIYVSSNRVVNNAPSEGVEAEEAILEVSPLSTIGPVIIVNENNEVEEQHREWHLDASMLRDAEETSLLPTVLAEEEVAAQSERRVQLEATDDDHDSRSRETGFVEGHSRPRIVCEDDIQSLNRTNDSSSLQSHRRPRAHRTNSNSRSVDIFSPPESKQRHEDPEVARDERYRPLAPFDRNDRRKWGKRPIGP